MLLLEIWGPHLSLCTGWGDTVLKGSAGRQRNRVEMKNTVVFAFPRPHISPPFWKHPSVACAFQSGRGCLVISLLSLVRIRSALTGGQGSALRLHSCIIECVLTLPVLFIPAISRAHPPRTSLACRLAEAGPCHRVSVYLSLQTYTQDILSSLCFFLHS